MKEVSGLNYIKKSKEIEKQIIKWRRDLHRIPEVSFETIKTRKYIEQVLDDLEVPYQSGIANNGIVATLSKKNSDFFNTIAIRADMDGLKIEEQTGLSFSSNHKGKMHACGHDGHMAIALGAAKILSKNFRKINGNIKFIFQPAEEGPGGAKK